MHVYCHCLFFQMDPFIITHCPSFPSSISCLKVYFWHVILFYFSSPFTFSLSCVFIFHIASCQQDITVLFGLTMCLLVREFSPLTFGMITNMVVIILLSRCFVFI